MRNFRVTPAATLLIRNTGLELAEFLNAKKTSKSAAADLLGQPESYMNRRVKGVNMTLRSLANMVDKLGGRVKVVIRPVRGTKAA